MGGPEVEAFLTWLAVEKNVSKSTQNQALNALVFLYRHVLKQPLEGRINAVRSFKKQRLPIVLSKEEVQRVLSGMSGTTQLMAKLLYGSGLRLMECIRLGIVWRRCEYSKKAIRSIHTGFLPIENLPGFHPQMALFPLSGVLRGFSPATYAKYASA